LKTPLPSVLDFEQASGLGMGCWQLAGAHTFGGKVNGYGDISENEAIETVRFALENDIHFFDTANGYGHGLSEIRLGKALADHREETVICTKFGPREDDSGEAYQDFSPEFTKQALDETLNRLSTSYLDILLLHNPPDDFDWINYDRSVLEELKRGGKIRAYGVSCRSVYGALNAVKAGFGDFVEVIFNLLDRRAEEDLFGLARERGIRIIARVPLASGFLTDRFLNEDPDFPKNDIRSSFPDDMKAWMIESARKLIFLSEEPGGLAASALRFALFHPDVYAVIPGMRNRSQVEGNVQARSLGPLESTHYSRIENAVPEVFYKWLPR
jgi:aryl-alcohol dehydrogenase-like predicted oxidoreductase